MADEKKAVEEVKIEVKTPSSAPPTGKAQPFKLSEVQPTKADLPVLIWHKGKNCWISYEFMPTTAVTSYWRHMPDAPAPEGKVEAKK